MCFCGHTEYAFPMIHQVTNSVQYYPRLATRALDLVDAKGHILRVFNSMQNHIHDLPQGQKEKSVPEVGFILGGYSWKHARFYIWEFHYKQSEKAFRQRQQSTIMRNPCAVILDGSPGGLTVDTIRHRIHQRMEANGKHEGDGMDMEPLEVLRDILVNKEDPCIGGSVQVVKVSKHMNAMPYCIKWVTDGNEAITLFGRPLLKYEKIPLLVMEMDKFATQSFTEAVGEDGLAWDDGLMGQSNPGGKEKTGSC